MEKIIELVNRLRDCGVKIGTDEVITLTKSLEVMPVSFSTLQTTAQAALIKDSRQIKLFNYLFHAIFGDDLDNLFQTEEETKSGYPIEHQASSSDGKGMALTGTGQSQKLSYFIKVNQPKEAERMIIKALQEQVDEENLSLREQLQRIKTYLDWNMEIYRLEKERDEIGEESFQELRSEMDKLEDKILYFLTKKAIDEGNSKHLVELGEMTDLSKKKLSDLSAHEESQVKKEVVKMGRKLATKKHRKWKQSKKGKVDLSKTVKQSGKNAGEVVNIYYRQRKINKPNLVLLCDVSGSVATYTQFMLLLVFSMQQSFQKVKSFVFVDEIQEITSSFKAGSIESAISDFKTKAQCSSSGQSDFGRVFYQFAQSHLDILTPKTDVVILGDAKNNWRHPQADQLQKIKQHCRHIYWLNPAKISEWGEEDSIIYLYKPSCKQIFECRNLTQLTQAAKVINS